MLYYFYTLSQVNSLMHGNHYNNMHRDHCEVVESSHWVVQWWEARGLRQQSKAPSVIY